MASEKSACGIGRPNVLVTRLARVSGALALALAATAHAQAPSSKTPDAEAQRQEAWREAIKRLPQPQEGCFAASYPETKWTPVACKTAPARPYLPRHGSSRGFTVGNGNDYSAVVSGLMSSADGSFPVVTGLKSEKGYGGAANTYSLQLNSEFFTTPVCNNASNPSQCLGWEQFVYSSSSDAVFMQYWLINYGSNCPSGGWMSYSGSCYRNSAAVSVPLQKITQLPHLSLRGTANNSTDTLVLTTSTTAYSTSGRDSVVDLAPAWNASEFNVVGDGGGSAAKFNKGTSLTVEIALTENSTSAPSCEGNDGTTGETNNLTLGSCSTAGGSTPYVKFIEKN